MWSASVRADGLLCGLLGGYHLGGLPGDVLCLEVVLLDDLASELDREHQGRVWRYLRDSAVQVMATGTELPTVLPREWVDAMFHVERHADGAALAPVS